MKKQQIIIFIELTSVLYQLNCCMLFRFIKLITAVYQLLFFETNDLHTLDIMFWKNFLNFLSSLNMCRQIKYHQLRIRNEIFISLKIILNAFNVWQYHFLLKSTLVYFKTNCFVIGPHSVELWKLLMNWVHFINNFIKCLH